MQSTLHSNCTNYKHMFVIVNPINNIKIHTNVQQWKLTHGRFIQKIKQTKMNGNANSTAMGSVQKTSSSPMYII